MPSEVPPLSSLTASMSTITVAFATPTAGAQPSLSGAPPLPTWSYTAGAYPAQDKIPPTNSSQVQGWINAIDWTKVPSYAANSPATTGSLCDTNTAAAADASRW
ncbi:hypothetical protein [Phaffia rhodozyma]|uniref:Uncharacterized protein n=1 Tax=Phaffia rhodozyma TaxID=264483 RepID=A0A0F7SIH6_PHARH|nr:hypothetical protein [Phaffia rhodozyma]